MTITVETENTERVAKIFEAFVRGDIGYVLDQLAEDASFVSHLDTRVPWAGEYSGKEEVARYFRALGGAVEVVGHSVNTLVSQGDTVVASGEVSFVVRESGRAGTSRWVYIFRLANGQVQSYDQFNDAGLVEAFS